jgi:predicted aconitase
MGYTRTIERAGARLVTNSCPLVSGLIPPGTAALALDSAKQAHYLKSEVQAEILYGSLADCLKTAVSGRWEGAAG